MTVRNVREKTTQTWKILQFANEMLFLYDYIEIS